MTVIPTADGTAAAQSVQPKPRLIQSCNFRYAGRLSNENVRTLTALHEKFALNATNSLELFLGASLLRSNRCLSLSIPAGQLLPVT
jgi:flagellar motor switch protein FliM